MKVGVDSASQTLRVTMRSLVGTGAGCVIAFLYVWLAGWTVGGVTAIAELLRGGSLFLVFWLCGWLVGEVFALGIVLLLLFGRSVVILEPERLVVEQWWLRWRRSKSVQRTEIREVVQSKNVSEGGIAWGLGVRGTGEMGVLSSRTSEETWWLGQVLSLWSGAPFRPAEQEPGGSAAPPASAPGGPSQPLSGPLESSEPGLDEPESDGEGRG